MCATRAVRCCIAFFVLLLSAAYAAADPAIASSDVLVVRLSFTRGAAPARVEPTPRSEAAARDHTRDWNQEPLAVTSDYRFYLSPAYSKLTYGTGGAPGWGRPSHRVWTSEPHAEAPGVTLGDVVDTVFSGRKLAIYGGLLASALVTRHSGIDDHISRGVRRDALPDSTWDYFDRAGEDEIFYVGPAIAGLGSLLGDERLAMSERVTKRALVYAGAANLSLKMTTQQERPDGSDRYSFVSGHVTTNTAVLASVRRTTQDPFVTLLTYAVNAGVAAQRIAANRHRFGDTLGGFILGEMLARDAYAQEMYGERPAPTRAGNTMRRWLGEGLMEKTRVNISGTTISVSFSF